VWPLSEDLDDAQLEALLFPLPPAIASDQRPLPDWAWVHRELRRPDVTLALLWEEYRAGAPDGFGYSWYCDLYRAWAGRLKPTMRQTHIAGEKLFVDFAGRTGEVVDAAPARSSRCRSLSPSWARRASPTPRRCGARSCRTGSPRMSAPLRISRYRPADGQRHLKAGITKACFYEPMVNRTYADLARHYGTAIVPARPYRPRDKAKVEVGVQVVGRWILARLRHRRFFALAELNAAIRALLDEVNNRPMRGWA